MPLPTPLERLVTTRRFWTDFFWQTSADEEYSGLEGLVVAFPVAEGSELALTVNESLSHFSLHVNGPGLNSEIAWDDQAHWHPHALRWAELEVICQALSVLDLDLPHPGPALLLLHRFAPICEGDDLDRIAALLHTAWEAVGVFSPSEIQGLIERSDARGAGFTWRRSGDRWLLEQSDAGASRALYTLRSAANEAFPFEALQELLDAAQAVVDGGPPAPSLRSEGPALRQSHSLSLRLSMRRSRPRFPSSAPGLVAQGLNRALSDNNAGESEVGGASMMTGKGGVSIQTDATLWVLVKGDLEWGRRLIRQALWWIGAPPSTKLSLDDASNPLPLDLRAAPEAPGELWLELCDLRVARWRPQREGNHRFDRRAFDEGQRAGLRAALDGFGAGPPNQDGWFSVPLGDEGGMRVCLRRLDQDPDLDGATIVIGAPSLAAATVVHQLMDTAGLFLMPLVAVTAVETGARLDTAWPNAHVVETPQALHEILERGPYAWWCRTWGR